MIRRRCGNKKQLKTCLWDDICKFGYAETKDRKTTVKHLPPPPWRKKIKEAGEKIVTLPGMPELWNRTIREQRDDVFMEAFWKCESAKSQARKDKRQNDMGQSVDNSALSWLTRVILPDFLYHLTPTGLLLAPPPTPLSPRPQALSQSLSS